MICFQLFVKERRKRVIYWKLNLIYHLVYSKCDNKLQSQDKVKKSYKSEEQLLFASRNLQDKNRVALKTQGWLTPAEFTPAMPRHDRPSIPSLPLA